MSVIDGEVLAVVDEQATARVTTWEQASQVSPYELAEWWRESAVRGEFRDATVPAELERLAVMSALSSHLEDIAPEQMHAALLAGASREQVAAAYGTDVAAARRAWSTWIGARRTWALTTPPGSQGDRAVPAFEVETVTRRWEGRR